MSSIKLIRKAIEENNKDYLINFKSIFEDPTSMIKIYGGKSDLKTILQNIELRLDIFTTPVKKQALDLIHNLNNTEEDEIRMIEIFGAKRHYVIYLNSNLTEVYGKLEILKTKKEDLLKLESKYQKLGLKLDGFWEPISM